MGPTSGYQGVQSDGARLENASDGGDPTAAPSRQQPRWWPLSVVRDVTQHNLLVPVLACVLLAQVLRHGYEVLALGGQSTGLPSGNAGARPPRGRRVLEAVAPELAAAPPPPVPHDGRGTVQEKAHVPQDLQRERAM